jgi:predicted metalloprotease
MRWGDMRPSDNVSDAGSGGGGFPLGGGMRLGGGAIILIVIVSLIFGVNPLSILGMLDGGGGPVVTQQAPPQTAQQREQQAAKDPTFDFVRRVTGDTEDVWTALFKNMGSRYEPPKLRTFHGMTNTGCGGASKASGPFYCPADRTVYLDTEFFQQLSQRFGAPGDFAAAYVIAHEIGHHVQTQLGTMDKFEATAQRGDPRSRNAMSVRLELQADCYAGVWGFYAAKRGLLEPPRSATTTSPRAACRPMRSRTAPPRSARSGSGRACRPAIRARATPSQRPPASGYFFPLSPWKRTRRTTRSYSASTATVTSSLRAV